MTNPGLKTLTGRDLSELARRFKQALINLYGTDLERLVLFGSYTKGAAKPDSDVDFLVVLAYESVAFGEEVDKISEVASQLGLEYVVHVSAKPVSSRAYHQSNRLFYQAVRSEGISI